MQVMFCQIKTAVDGVETPPVILGDAAFPLRSSIMKPHGDAVLTPQKNFNYCLSPARIITEGVFGKLKGKFRVLFHKCESKKENENYVILHNLCIEKRRHYT